MNDASTMFLQYIKSFIYFSDKSNITHSLENSLYYKKKRLTSL